MLSARLVTRTLVVLALWRGWSDRAAQMPVLDVLPLAAVAAVAIGASVRQAGSQPGVRTDPRHEFMRTSRR